MFENEWLGSAVVFPVLWGLVWLVPIGMPWRAVVLLVALAGDGGGAWALGAAAFFAGVAALSTYATRRWFGPMRASRRYLREGGQLTWAEGPISWTREPARRMGLHPGYTALRVGGETFDVTQVRGWSDPHLLPPGLILRVWYVPTTRVLVRAAIPAR